MSPRKLVPISPRTWLLVDVAFLACVILVVVVLVPAARALVAGSSALRPLTRSPSSCTMGITTTMAQEPRRLCDAITVTTAFTPACPSCPGGLNVVFIQDDTPYPEWQKRVSLQALTALQQYASSTKMPVSVGVLHYNGQGVRTALRPTLSIGAARGPLTSFRVAHDPRALFMEAAQEGVAMIRQARRLHDDASDPQCEFVIFFVYTKIYMEDKGQEMIQAGRTILRAVPNLYVGCPHQHPEECTIWEPQVPKSQRYYTEDPEASKLLGMVNEGLRDIDSKGAIRVISMSTDQWLPPELELMPNTFNIAPASTVIEGGRTRLTWNWRSIRLAEPVSVTFQAMPRAPGERQTNLKHEWRDSANRMGEIDAVSRPITIEDDDCSTPTPTPTDLPPPPPSETPIATGTSTPTGTPTATATSSAIPTHTSTSTPLPTPTPRTGRIYLPIMVGEQCVPEDVHADVALVLDVSTSMRRLTRTGRTKLAATQDAAKQFVDLMDLAADARGDHDQVTVVGFNQDAWIQIPLSADGRRIRAAIDALSDLMAERTRLDLALEVGASAILEGPRRAGNTPVLILLTDGLPNQVPYAEDGTVETTVLRAAKAAKDAGIIVFTIAIGAPEDTNPVLLTGCASGANHYYYTPDPDDLAAIYRSIAYEIDCPRSMFWGSR